MAPGVCGILRSGSRKKRPTPSVQTPATRAHPHQPSRRASTVTPPQGSTKGNPSRARGIGSLRLMFGNTLFHPEAAYGSFPTVAGATHDTIRYKHHIIAFAARLCCLDAGRGEPKHGGRAPQGSWMLRSRCGQVGGGSVWPMSEERRGGGEPVSRKARLVCTARLGHSHAAGRNDRQPQGPLRPVTSRGSPGHPETLARPRTDRQSSARGAKWRPYDLCPAA